MKQTLLFFVLFVLLQTSQSQVSYTWNGSVSSSWNVPNNWAPAGIPTSIDNVTIVTGANTCALAVSQSINNLTLTSGTLDLGAGTLTVNGTTATFTKGTVQNGTISITGANATSFGAGPVIMNCQTNINTATVTITNTTFQNTLNLTKTGTSSDWSSGNNIFNGTTTMTNTGTGYLLLGNGNPDQFNGNTTFNNTGSNNIYVAWNSSNNIFNGPTTFNNSPTANTLIYVSWNSSGTVFNNNITVSSTNGQGIQFCGGNATASAQLASGFSINIGGAGFSAGILSLRQFTQVGTTPINITASGTAQINLGPSSNFSGPLTVAAPNIYPQTTIFNNTVVLTKTDGTNSNATSGGNTYNSSFTANYFSTNGTGYWSFANGAPDVYNGDVYSNNNSLDRIIFGHNSANNLFNGNLYVTQIGSSAGTALTWNSGSSCIMAAGKSIFIGAAGFSAGYFYIQGYTQNGNAAINLSTTGSASIFVGAGDTGNPSVIGGSFTATAADIYLRGGTFNGPVVVTKTGGGSDHNNQYTNIFNSTVTINQQSNGGYFMLGYNSNDQFNGNITVSCTGTGGIYLGWTSGTGTPTLASGYTIQVGAAGFNAGFLSLNTFTQLGNAPISLSFTGTNTSLIFARNSVIGGNLLVNSPDIYFNGCTFNGTVDATKTGSSGDWGLGGNIFNGICNITNSGSSYLLMGNSNPDIWNSDVTFTDNGSERLLPCWGSVGNQFNGNINVNTGGSAQGIQFCGGNNTATATLAAGKTILVGSSGLNAGYLQLRQFTQLGNTPINLTLNSTASYLQFGPLSSIGGNVVSSSPGLYFNGSTFSGTVNSTKTGSTNDASSGNNVFNDTATFNNTGSGYLMLGNGNPDIWNSDALFNNNGTSQIYPCWNSAGNLFNGNIIFTSTGSAAGISFCGGASSNATQSGTGSIAIGAAGFSSGYLNLQRFTKLTTTASNLTFTGTNTYITVGPSSAIGGNFTATAPSIYLNGAVYSGDVNITKNGAVGEWSNGGNTFNGTTTINQLGAGYFAFGNGAPDIFNGDLYVNNNSTERVIFGNTPTGNQFNGNIILTQIGSSVGIAFGWSVSTSETLAAGKTISIGAAGFNVGYLQIERFTQLGNTAINLPLTGTASLTFGPNSVIGGNLISTSATLLLNGCTFNGTVNSTKTGATNDASNGNNIFNDTANFTNAGSGNLMFGNGNADQFNSASIFNNTGSNNIYVAWNSSNNIFGGTTTFNNAPTANTAIYVSWNSANTVFNNNIIVSSTNGQGVQFCGGNSSASATLNGNINIGPAGFSSGTLLLRQFTQLAGGAENLTLTGTGNLTFGPSSSFSGNMTSSSPTLYFNGCTFNGTTDCTKTGSTGDWGQGGNIFNGVSNITNSGSSYLLMGSTNPDIWNSDVTFTDNGTERLLPCWSSVGNQFNGNIYVNTGGSAQGIQFCGGNNTATAILAAGGSVYSGNSGLNAGYLQLRQFTQLGNAPINLTLSSSATYLQFGPLSSFGGNIVSTSPGLYFNGSTFSGTVNSTKTGSSNDASSGNNIFNNIATFTNSGSGYLLFGNGNADQFNAASTFNNTGSNNIYVAWNSSNNIFGGVTTFNNSPTANTLIYVSWNSAGTIFNNNIMVSSTNGQGVQFCGGNSSASAILSSGNTISVCGAGFSAGTLLLQQFTQTGPTAQNLVLTGTGNLTFGPSSSFSGDVTTVSPTLYFNGCNFGGIVNSTKNGSSNDASSGNNNFIGAFTVTNIGAGYFLMGNGNPDTWQSTATFNNQSSGQHMYVAYNSTGNTFNGDVNFNNQPGSNGLWIYPNYYGVNTQFNGNIYVSNVNGGGIYFGPSSGTSTLSGFVTVGAAGFNSGGLIFRNFTQTGAGATQNITTTGTSYIQYGTPALFTGPVISSSPSLYFNGATFNGTVNCTKTGSNNDGSTGNNSFNASSIFTNNGTGYLLMANNGPDAYNSDVSFVKGNTGLVYPNYNYNCNYGGNLSVNASSTITFGSGAGTATFSGSGLQNINASAGTPVPVFTRLVINNTGSGVTLNNTPVNVSGNLTLSAGLLNTNTTNILTMLNGATTAAGTALSTSYVNGPMRYQKSTAGISTLNFPIGNAPDCRPIVLTVNHSNGTLYNYQAQLYNANARALGYTLPPSVDQVSHVHYYTINRTDGSANSQPTAGLSGNQTIQIFFGNNDVVSNGGTLTIVKNTYTAPTAWINIGGIGGPAYAGGANLLGSITSTSSPSVFNSFSTFALADQSGGLNMLPTQLIYFNAQLVNSTVNLSWATASESNNHFFTIEKSRDGVNFDFFKQVDSKAFNGNSSDTLNYITYDHNPYQGLTYYRLSQTDLDGNVKYWNIVSVNNNQAQTVSIYPNPTTGNLFIKGLSLSETNLKIEWYDLIGRLMKQETTTVQNGIAQLNVQFSNGVYVLRYITADGTINEQRIIVRK